MSESRVQYPNVVRAISERPWAILESTLQTIVEMVGVFAAGERFTREQVEARIAAGPGSGGDAQVSAGIAVIPISGVIMPRASLFSDISGGTSVEGLRNSFAGAMQDERVKAVLFDIDSPGGTVDLVPELAADIREARGTKPIVAQVNTLMASAAYWLGAQADEVFITPSGQVGSIGVFGAHTDQSSLDEKVGLKTTLVSAGKFKTETNPHEPLGDDARAHLQSLVDATYDLFVGDVAAARGATPQAVRDGYGQGRLLEPHAAMREGLVDGIQTFEQTVSNLMRTGDAGEPASTASSGGVTSAATSTTVAVPHVPATLVDDAEAARAAAARVVTRIQALREVREGRLSSAKRDALEALRIDLLKAEDAIAEALSATPPAEESSGDTPVDLDAFASTMRARTEARLRLS